MLCKQACLATEVDGATDPEEAIGQKCTQHFEGSLGEAVARAQVDAGDIEADGHRKVEASA